MPFNNLGNKHITATQITDFDTALDTLLNIVQNITTNLSDEERSKYGSVNERNKLFINGVQDYAKTQPTLKSPDVDWTEFEKDYDDRKFADTRADRISNLLRMLTDFKIVHDYDNYQNALTDYDYTKYKAATNATGYTEKQAYLKQFFPNTGGTNTPPTT